MGGVGYMDERQSDLGYATAGTCIVQNHSAYLLTSDTI